MIVNITEESGFMRIPPPLNSNIYYIILTIKKMPRQKLNKPYYCFKGKYSDSRKRIIIRQDEKPEEALPKPEVLQELLRYLKENRPEIIGMCKRNVKYQR